VGNCLVDHWRESYVAETGKLMKTREATSEFSPRALTRWSVASHSALLEHLRRFSAHKQSPCVGLSLNSHIEHSTVW
jgi:hypothetical protein